MKHHIIVKYNDLVKDRAQFKREAEELFSNALKTEGVNGVKLIEGLPLAENRFDLMIVIDMEKESLPLYNESDYHKAWKRDYGKYILQKAIFDCE